MDKEKFYRLLRTTHSSIPPYLITLNNIDLSRSEFTSGLSNCNLVNVNLKKSQFQGTFYGTSFSGANLSYSLIKRGTRFVSVDFSGANLSNITADYSSEYSPFVAHFIDCDFSNCTMTNADLKETSFRLSNFTHTDISGANLYYADISLTKMVNIILDEKTDTSSINLLSKGYYFEWEDIRKNKELIRAILDDFDPHFDRKMKDKILTDNPDYS